MKAKEYDYRAHQKYRKEKCRKIQIELVKERDAEMLAWLDAQPSKQGYLKALIRADMEKHIEKED